MQKQRRDFFKLTAVGATGLVLARTNRAFAAWPASGTMAINPDISNMRVVGLVDTAMVPTAPSAMTFAAENTAVDAARVAANLDAMAMALAGKCTPDEAWKTIFRSSRPWSSTVVAIKINTAESKNMARVAVVDKLCRVLNGFGVPAANIFLYDAHGSTTSYSSYCSKTDTSKIPAVVDSGGMGGQINVPLPDGTTAPCAKQIADGTVDILINIPTNKGHSAFGGATLSLKNHFGTFAPNHFCPPGSDAGQFCSNPDTTKFYNYVFNISKSDAIIGGTPARQQLCVVDSLIANKVENTGTPEATPCYLVMGTFGPAVDYLTIKKIREAVMGATHTASLVNQYMTQFGYTTADPVWVQVDPAAGAPTNCGATGGGGNSDSGGGTGSGGNSGSGGAGSGGSKGSGGAGSGGRSGSGGAGSGGAGSGGTQVSGSGGAGSGGRVGSGGAGSGGTTVTGGASGSGGTTSSGGAGGSGGASGSGGVTSAMSGSGGATAASGGGTGAGKGCGCDVGEASRGFGRWGALFALGAVAAGQMRRLLLRRDMLARPTQSEDPTEVSETKDNKE